MRQREWGAVVVGSGANGGVAAKLLAEAGIDVLVLEAGPSIEEAGGYGDGLSNLARRVVRLAATKRQSVQSLHSTYWTTNPNFFVDDVENPYSTPPELPFRWIRARITGGRTLVWDGVTPRMSDHELRAGERDGVGPSWPIGHDDLAPWYAKLERYFGIAGNRDGAPSMPDGSFCAPGPMTPSETVFRDRLRRELPERPVLASRGLRAGRAPPRGRKHSKLSNVSTTLSDALATGRATLRSLSVASRVILDRPGRRAIGVEYVDARTGRSHLVRGRLVVLCASTIESVRLLLNSRTPDRPHGLGGDSGHLGRCLMDHVAGNLYFQLPDVPPASASHPLSGSDAFIVPRYQNLGRSDAPHLRGFGMWGGIDRIGLPRLLQRTPGEAFGFVSTRGEVLPHPDNRVTIDPDLVDAWGIPAAHVRCEWKENDLRVAHAARRAAIEMVEAAGGEVADLSAWVRSPLVGARLRTMEQEWRLSTPGLLVHELGGARMGRSPSSSVVDPQCALWDVPNVLVTDGACWPSSGWQNPTLTEMAVTARAVSFAAGRPRPPLDR